VEHTEGHDKEHPIVLEGYTKDEFSCLLRVMFPRTKALISGTKWELSLKKEEWVSVLKLSTIWNMSHIRQYAIHRLSTDEAQALTSIEKIQLAREYSVAKWMEEGLISLVTGGYRLTHADLTTLGWETSALILWIRDNSIPSLSSPFRFTQDMIQCRNCSSNLTSESLGSELECYSCDLRLPLGIGEHTVPVASFSVENASELGKFDPGPLVKLEDIRCSACECRFYSKSFRCPSCSVSKSMVRIALKKRIDEKIDEVFGDEIREYKLVVD